MTQVHTDPEKLRDFAARVERFAEEVDRELNRLSGAVTRLGNTWQDREYDDFVKEFALTRGSVKKLIQEMRETTTPRLKRDADKLDPYFK
jgi:WXG100 family type VII secretion target